MTRITSKYIALLTALVVSLAQAGSLEPLNDAEMESVTGQNAIQLTVKMHNNVQVKDNEHVRLSMCDPNGAGYSPCRLGMEFVDKERNWLVMKQFYGYLNLTDIRLEGVSLPTTNTAYYDEDRFKRADGSCMIAGTCNPRGLAAIEMRYPSSKGPGQYQDMQTFLNIGAMVVETNNPSATYSDGSNPNRPDAVADYGFMRDQTQGVANAFRISDSSGPNANMQVRFDGSTLIYGF